MDSNDEVFAGMDVITQLFSETWAVLLEMAPYLIFGFLVAGVLSVLISPETVERHLGGRGFRPVIKAAAFGVPLPLCSCGVIPVGASLRRHGASRAATTAFLLSTPQTGVDSILVTWGLLGPLFAIVRPIAALITGFVGGGLVMVFGENGDKAAPPARCQDGCCDGRAKSNRIVEALRYALVTLPRDLTRPLLLGVVLAGLISTVVPDDFFAGALGSGIGAMLVMMLVGIPLYVCATASVPIAAMLMMKGLSPGAALVFLITGPATNIATIVTIASVMGRRTAGIYLLTVAVCALGAGVVLDALWAGGMYGALPEHHIHHEGYPVFKTVCAIGLLAMLAWPLLFGKRGGHALTSESQSMPGEATVELVVSGMTCTHCVASVQKAVETSAGVRHVNVDLASGRVEVIGMGLDVAKLCDLIDGLGFQAVSISPDHPVNTGESAG